MRATLFDSSSETQSVLPGPVVIPRGLLVGSPPSVVTSPVVVTRARRPAANWATQYAPSCPNAMPNGSASGRSVVGGSPPATRRPTCCGGERIREQHLPAGTAGDFLRAAATACGVCTPAVVIATIAPEKSTTQISPPALAMPRALRRHRRS